MENLYIVMFMVGLIILLFGLPTIKKWASLSDSRNYPTQAAYNKLGKMMEVAEVSLYSFEAIDRGKHVVLTAKYKVSGRETSEIQIRTDNLTDSIEGAYKVMIEAGFIKED